MKPLSDLRHLATLNWEILAPLDWQAIPYLRTTKANPRTGRRKLSTRHWPDKCLVAVGRDSDGRARYLGYYKPEYDFCGAYADCRENPCNTPVEAIDTRIILGTATPEEIDALLLGGKS